MKTYDVRIEALSYALHQVYTSHAQVVGCFGDTDNERFEQMKAIVGEIEFRLDEMLECYTPDENLAMHESAKAGYYDPDLIYDIRKSTDMDNFNIRREIRKCSAALWQCADNPGKEVFIVVGNQKFTFYDHAAFIQGLSDALDYFESEL